jgi:hypothetical protein
MMYCAAEHLVRGKAAAFQFWGRRTLVVSLSVSHAGNWGKILILFRHTLLH